MFRKYTKGKILGSKPKEASIESLEDQPETGEEVEEEEAEAEA